MAEFARRLAQVKEDIIEQGERVIDQTLTAIEAYFERNEQAAADAVTIDEAVDEKDVAIERASVHLLTMGESDHQSIRQVLAIVKINNEIERIANCAVNIAEVILNFDDEDEDIPKTFRVMANSVIGMCRDSMRSFEHEDADLALQVLGCDDAVDQFKRQISLDAETKVASGSLSVGFAFRLRTVVSNLERIADHCTNISQQVIYLQRGLTVRHSFQGGWSAPESPASE